MISGLRCFVLLHIVIPEGVHHHMVRCSKQTYLCSMHPCAGCCREFHDAEARSLSCQHVTCMPCAPLATALVVVQLARGQLQERELRSVEERKAAEATTGELRQSLAAERHALESSRREAAGHRERGDAAEAQARTNVASLGATSALAPSRSWPRLVCMQQKSYVLCC